MCNTQAASCSCISCCCTSGLCFCACCMFSAGPFRRPSLQRAAALGHLLLRAECRMTVLVVAVIGNLDHRLLMCFVTSHMIPRNIIVVSQPMVLVSVVAATTGCSHITMCLFKQFVRTSFSNWSFRCALLVLCLWYHNLW